MVNVRDEIDRYLQRIPNARAARLQDAQYQWQIEWTRRMLELADLAMDNEEIPEDVRVRVVRAVLFGAADEPEALRRIEQNRQMEQFLRDAAARPLQVDGLTAPDRREKP